MTLTPFRGRCHTCGHDHDAEGQRLRDVLDICTASAESGSSSWMPVLGYPLAIPFALLDARQAEVNHGQPLARLAERGGLGLAEAAALAERRPWRHMTTDEALAALRDVAMRRGIRAT